MKITVLTENTGRSGLPTEHGLSLFLETGAHKILFDAGQSDLFLQNAEKLGVDLKKADLAVLSHGHYDHGGGLPFFLAYNETAPVYISPYAFDPCYNAGGDYIGLPPALQGSERLIFAENGTEIGEGLTLLSPQRRFPDLSRGLYRKENGRTVPDDFRHEQYLMIEERGRKILISGCSHRGVLSLARFYRPDILIGGFHLMNEPLNESLKARAEALNETGVSFLTCHCTGVPQFDFIKPYMKDLRYLSTGDTLTV